MALFNGLRQLTKLKGFSLGLVIMLVQLWFLVNVSTFFPTNPAKWQNLLLVLLMMQATVFAVPDLRSKLFNFSFISEFPRLIMFLILGILVTGFIVKSTGVGVPAILAGVSVGVLIVHGFVVGVVEEFFFRDFLLSRVGMIPANLLFGSFHWVAYSGNLVTMLVAVGFGFIMTFLKLRFSPQSNSANIGFHWGWNVALLGIGGA